MSRPRNPEPLINSMLEVMRQRRRHFDRNRSSLVDAAAKLAAAPEGGKELFVKDVERWIYTVTEDEAKWRVECADFIAVHGVQLEAILKAAHALLCASLEEKTRTSLTSLPLKVKFADSRGMDLKDVEPWMSNTWHRFAETTEELDLAFWKR